MTVAVIGGGISGLVAASELVKAGVEVVLYEKEDNLGAHSKTATFSGTELDLSSMLFNLFKTCSKQLRIDQVVEIQGGDNN
ncbi:hypothetical protein RJ641_003823 [Dillenia turbinata]|uniref:Uncharacterized protein n=1 Tax=Dillenia turbinata TaxID=194707 RepID=A0AAN8Z7Q1_9MAGN